MSGSLLKLLRFRFVGFLRRFVTRGSVTKRVVGGIVAIFLFFSWIAPALFAGMSRYRTQVAPEDVLLFAPLVLALVVAMRLAMAAGSASLAFSPAEMDFLFPGPFSRRQLLVYKLVGGMAGAAFLALILASQFRHFAASWLSGFLAILLSAVLMQFVGVVVALMRQRLGQSTFGRISLVLLAIVVLGGMLAAWPSVKAALQPGAEPFNLTTTVRGIAERVQGSPSAGVVFAPFKVFARVMVSPPGQALAMWLAGALSILGLLLAIIFRLDAAYAEVAVTVSSKYAQKMERAKSFSLGVNTKPTFSIPQFPRLGGAGPIAWRQVIAAVRNIRALLFLTVVMGGFVAFIISLNKSSDLPARTMLIPMFFPLYIVMMNALRFDFRTDIDQIDTLKSLPAGPRAVAIGEIFVPVCVLCALLSAAVLAVHFFAPGGFGSIRSLAWTLLSIVPTTIVICALENVAFLLFPTRHPAGTAADMNTMLRFIAVRLIKFAMLLPCAAAIGGLAAAVWFTTKSPWATFAAAWLAACLIAAVSIIGVAHAFKRFDPSRDMPA